MEKKIICLLMTIFMLIPFCTQVFADSETEPQLYNVTDAAGLLDSSELVQLETLASETSDQYGVGIYIVTMNDYRDANSEGAYEATYTIYHEYTMGVGENRNGIMLMLSMNERDWAMFVYGDYAEYAFNYYGQEKLEDSFLDNFSENDWYGGFENYIEECTVYLEKASAGHPVRKSPVVPIIFFCGLSLLIALIVLGIMWNKMKSVHIGTNANTYVSGDLELTEQSDLFTHRTRTRRKIKKSSSSGSSSHSGGGGSGRSGKF